MAVFGMEAYNNDMKHRQGFAPIILVIIVAAILAAGGVGYYLNKKSAPAQLSTLSEKLPPPATVSTSTPAGPGQDLFSAIQAQWDRISPFLTQALGHGPGLYPGAKGYAWHLDGVQTISATRAFIQFEDGYNEHVALLEYADGQFSVGKIFPNQARLANSMWLPVVNQYGADLVNYALNDQSQLAKVDYNIILNKDMQVKIALLSMPAKDEDVQKLQGCDLVIMTEQTVPYTTMPLNAAMRQLFMKLQRWPYDDSHSGNFISSQKNLYFDKAVLADGVAKIYLTGSVSLGGECDDPRLDIVIKNTAMQFPSVKSVQIYLNGQPLVVPNGRGY